MVAKVVMEMDVDDDVIKTVVGAEAEVVMEIDGEDDDVNETVIGA